MVTIERSIDSRRGNTSANLAWSVKSPELLRCSLWAPWNVQVHIGNVYSCMSHECLISHPSTMLTDCWPSFVIDIWICLSVTSSGCGGVRTSARSVHGNHEEEHSRLRGGHDPRIWRQRFDIRPAIVSRNSKHHECLNSHKDRISSLRAESDRVSIVKVSYTS